MQVFGLDIGGTGIKGALVDTDEGKLLSERIRIPTPQPATPEAMIQTAAQVVREAGWQGPVGCGFPAVVRHGVVHTAANIDNSWIGVNLEADLAKELGQPVACLNDADAAGLAELRFGAGHNQRGLVFMLTFGTGIGTALFTDGHLVPNTELGHLILDGKIAEAVASEAARDREDLKWSEWAKRVTKYMRELERLFWPDLFIVGGGASKKFEKWGEHLKLNTPVVPAEMRNLAGIVGAAAWMEETLQLERTKTADIKAIP